MKFITFLLLLLTPMAQAEIPPGQYEITVSFGEQSFTDILEIEESIQSLEPCLFSESSKKLIGSFTSPGRFTVPLIETSCIGIMGSNLRGGFQFSLLVDEGSGPQKYEFIGETNYRPWSNVSALFGDVFLEGKKIGKFESFY